MLVFICHFFEVVFSTVSLLGLVSCGWSAVCCVKSIDHLSYMLDVFRFSDERRSLDAGAV